MSSMVLSIEAARQRISGVPDVYPPGPPSSKT